MRISSDSSVARLKALALKNFWIISGIISFHASRIQFITARQDKPFKFPVEVSWLIPFSASYLSYFFVAIALTLSCRRSSLYRNQPLICRANQCNSLYMIGISVMKKLKGLFRLTSGECIDLVNPLRRIETILFIAWSNNFALSLIRHWFELHTRWWRRNENAPITWFTHVWVNSEFIQAFGWRGMVCSTSSYAWHARCRCWWSETNDHASHPKPHVWDSWPWKLLDSDFQTNHRCLRPDNQLRYFSRTRA